MTSLHLFLLDRWVKVAVRSKRSINCYVVFTLKKFCTKNQSKICHFCNVNSRSIKFVMSTIHFVLLFLCISQSYGAIVEELDSSEVLNSHVVPYHSDKLQCEYYNATCFSEGLDPKSCQGMFKDLYGQWKHLSTYISLTQMPTNVFSNYWFMI